MIKIDGIKQLTAQLEQFHKDTVVNLTEMAGRFAKELAQTASNNTPLGNQDILSRGFSDYGSLSAPERKYYQYYVGRRKQYGIGIYQGFHAGAYTYSEHSFVFDRTIYSQLEMLGHVQSGFEQNYKLGDTFYIGASDKHGGYYALDVQHTSAKAPDGITKPTINEIVAAYATNLQYFYRSK